MDLQLNAFFQRVSRRKTEKNLANSNDFFVFLYFCFRLLFSLKVFFEKCRARLVEVLEIHVFRVHINCDLGRHCIFIGVCFILILNGENQNNILANLDYNFIKLHRS